MNCSEYGRELGGRHRILNDGRQTSISKCKVDTPYGLEAQDQRLPSTMISVLARQTQDVHPWA